MNTERRIGEQEVQSLDTWFSPFAHSQPYAADIPELSGVQGKTHFFLRERRISAQFVAHNNPLFDVPEGELLVWAQVGAANKLLVLSLRNADGEEATAYPHELPTREIVYDAFTFPDGTTKPFSETPGGYKKIQARFSLMSPSGNENGHKS